MRNELRSALRPIIEPASGQVAISFSGGTDSLCLLFTALELGVTPRLYTYKVRGPETADSERTRRMADHYKLEAVIVELPTEPESVIEDVRTMLLAGIRGKVGLQCMQGHIHLAPHVQDKHILNGSGVDGLYGSYKQFAFDGSSLDKAVFDERRRKHLDNPNDDCMEDQSRCYGKFGIQVHYPYREPAVVSWLMARSYGELMKPRYKAATVAEFPEFAQHKHLYRPRGSQQIVAGTRALHDKLLQHPVNRGHARVDEVYKDIAHSMGLRWR